MSTFTIPASLDEAVGQLEGIERLLTAKRWERAAILAAFVEIGEHGENRHTKRTLLSSRQFAALGIAGLKSHMTVREYVRRWLEDSGRPRPEPGQVIDLDGLPPWDKPEPGTKYPPGKGGAEQRIKDQPSTVTAALDDEQFLAKVVESMSNDQRTKVYRQINQRTRDLFDARAKAEGHRDVERLPIEASISRMHIANENIVEKLSVAASLLAEVNGAWSDYEGSIDLLRVNTELAAIRLELSVVEFYAGYDPDKHDQGARNQGPENQGSGQ